MPARPPRPQDAGSADAFRKVDLDYVVAGARAAKAAGTVKHFGLLGSGLASPNSMFLYLRTKGEAEEAVKGLKFPSTSIFHPGLLDRGDKARPIERVLKHVPFLPCITTADAAKAMVLDAFRALGAVQEGGGCGVPAVSYFLNGEMVVAAKEGRPPK